MKTRLIIDVGATGLRLLEVAVADGALTVVDAAVIGFEEPLVAGRRAPVVAQALRSLREGGRFAGREAALGLSADLVWVRPVALPPVSPEAARLRQIIEYEAKQRIPFPLDRVVWDYQLVVRGEDELEAIFAVAKQEIVAEMMAALRAVGLRASRIECAPTALYNLARANGFGTQRCEMLIDVGSRTTIALILLGNRFFLRSIGVGGETITQALAREFGIGRDEAELLKRRHGYVAMGEHYDEPGSEVAATTAKVTRRVMQKLAGELTRSIAAWRASGGEPPEQLHLSGGGSVLPFLPEYLGERLGLSVAAVNPLAPLALAPATMTATIRQSAHYFGKAVGVALREAGECPVEVDLLPVGARKERQAWRLLPYVGMAAALWLSLMTTTVLLIGGEAEVAATRLASASDSSKQLRTAVNQLASTAELEAEQEHQRRRLLNLAAHREATFAWWQAIDRARPELVRLTRIEPITATTVPEVSAKSIFQTPGQPTAKPIIEQLRLEGVVKTVPGDAIFAEAQLAQLLALAATTSGSAADGYGALPAEVTAEENRMTADLSRVGNAFLAALRVQPEFAGEEAEFVSFAAGGDDAGRFVLNLPLGRPLAEWGVQ